MRPVQTGLREPKEEPNAHTVEGDWEGKAVKYPCKKGFSVWKMRPDVGKIWGGQR